MPHPRLAPFALAGCIALALAGCGSDYPADWATLQPPQAGACPPLAGEWPLPDGAPPLPGLPADDAGQAWTHLVLGTPAAADGGLTLRLRSVGGHEHHDAWPEGTRFSCADGMLVMAHPGQPGATLAFAMSADDALVVRAQAARGDIVSPWCGVGCRPADEAPARTRWHRWTLRGEARVASVPADATDAKPAADPAALPIGSADRRPSVAEIEQSRETGRPLAWVQANGPDPALETQRQAYLADMTARMDAAAVPGPYVTPPGPAIPAPEVLPNPAEIDRRVRLLLPWDVEHQGSWLDHHRLRLTLVAPNHRRLMAAQRAFEGDPRFHGVMFKRIELIDGQMHGELHAVVDP